MSALRPEALAEARQEAARGQLIRLTAAAADEIRRLVGAASCIVEVRCVSEGTGFRHHFDLVPEHTPCVVFCMSQGVRIQAPDELSAVLLRGTEIDYVRSATQTGFAFRNPNGRSSG